VRKRTAASHKAPKTSGGSATGEEVDKAMIPSNKSLYQITEEVHFLSFSHKVKVGYVPIPMTGMSSSKSC